MTDIGKIEFFVSPEGVVMYQKNGGEISILAQKNRDIICTLLELVQSYYPEAFDTLSKMYAASKPNLPHYQYLMAHKFIRCNFGKFDGLTYDIDGGTLHIEDVPCPARLECPMAGVVCRPQPFGLTQREKEIAMLSSSGCSYDEIGERLGISHSTIKNMLQRVRAKLHLESSKDIAKMFVAVRK
jgi:DNA-binding CsgD family transcriptional regulator